MEINNNNNEKNKLFELSNDNLMKMEYFFLDIDETMGYAIHIDEMEWEKLYNKKYCKIISTDDKQTYFWFPRPNLDCFLKIMIPKCKGWGIWTSGSKNYAKSIVNKFLIPQGFHPDWVFSFDNCSIDFISGIARKKMTKALNGMQNNIQKWLSCHNHCLNENDILKRWSNATIYNTWLIDDLENHFTNETFGIMIKPYDPLDRKKDDLYKQLLIFFS